MSELPALRSADMTPETLQAEARHLRVLARLFDGRPRPPQDAWADWGVAEVVATRGAPQRSLQVGELVLVAPHAAGAERVMVHSQIRADDILVPRRCVRVVLEPTGDADR